jgi:membrane protease YdiL (CAAX protease family)
MTTNQRSQPSPAIQLILFIGITIGAILLGYLLGALVIFAVYGLETLMQLAQLNLSNADTINALWILQVVSTTIPLFIAPVFFANVIVKQPREYLSPALNFPPLLLVLVFCIMFISSPLIEFLANINQKMSFPPSLKFIYDWMREKEDTAQKLTGILLKMKTVGSMIRNVIIVGLLTAVAEEFMFRGVIQTIFTRWTKNYHAAIWITAILFSSFHMEFFGFLPRMALGALLGYMVAWSGSIWPAVWGHFINNGTAVVVTYLYQHKKIKVNPDDQHMFNYAAYMFSLIIVLFLLFMYHKLATEKKQIQAG